MTQVNIFTKYEQRENNYTNGFISLLRMAPLGHPRLLAQLLEDQLGLPGSFAPNDFKVLRGIDGYPDGEVSGADFCIWFETKIVSGALRGDQVRRHLEKLDAKSHDRRYLVLLTPDDSKSSYVQSFLDIDPCRVRHLEWRRAYDLLDPPALGMDSVFSALAQQFRAHIQRTIFEQDYAGVILKVSFGKKSGVDKDKYLSEMRDGVWQEWNTPRQYKKLDGTGRKLLLYDSTRKAVTVEAEIGRVVKTCKELHYPWTNEFVRESINVFDTPIPLDSIRALDRFQNYERERSACRILTRDQYRRLLKHQS